MFLWDHQFIVYSMVVKLDLKPGQVGWWHTSKMLEGTKI